MDEIFFIDDTPNIDKTYNNSRLTVTPRNAEAFSEALITMKSDRESLFRMGQNAKQLASSKFDRNRLSDQFVDFLVTNINR